MVDLDAKHKELKARKARRKRAYSNLFLIPLIAPWQWAIAGLLFNIAAMIYLLGYAHGKGFPKAEV